MGSEVMGMSWILVPGIVSRAALEPGDQHPCQGSSDSPSTETVGHCPASAVVLGVFWSLLSGALPKG